MLICRGQFSRSSLLSPMDSDTALIVGGGAVAALLAARILLRRGGKGAAEQWVKGGFKAKMDRTEALSVLGLK